jgi:hypothetical protein
MVTLIVCLIALVVVAVCIGLIWLFFGSMFGGRGSGRTIGSPRTLPAQMSGRVLPGTGRAEVRVQEFEFLVLSP